MKKLIIRIVVIMIKIVGVTMSVGYAASHYNQSIKWYHQSPTIWLLLYLPIFMGYEALINSIFSPIVKKLEENNTQP